MTLGQFTAPGSGGFALSGEKNVTFSIGYVPVETRISAFECCFVDLGPSHLALPESTRIQLALFTLSPVTRLLLTYIAGSETDPTLTMAQARQNYENIMGSGGYRVPMNPTTLLQGFFGIGAVVDFTTSAGRLFCNNPTFPPAIWAPGAVTLSTGNFDYTTTTIVPATGALANLLLSDVTKYQYASANKQANIAWIAVADALGLM